MRSFLMSAAFLVASVASGGSAFAGGPLDGSFQVAQAGSCQSSFRTCAARCKERAPKDKSCASDHCSPKLAECRQTGCWQEGALYGGAKQCGLPK